ncbi:hypothetical protein CRM22_009116 [Opisthorchis felineus]|uniref:Indoleamine 2,3-dioxygenase n=1 Tax=Opisthorchis felineus TaxID=147828 RepID=A0A4S2L8Q7_OPIFE|nr:hypothetical protein CRM22_009116 [Opisthorchis felineus]
MQSLKYYQLSRKTGAMLETPLTKLPEKFKVWNDLIDNLPELFRTGSLRAEVRALPLLHPDGLTSVDQLRLAHKILAFATSSYVWMNGDEGAAKSIPPQLAIPLVEVSEKLALKPVITYHDLVLTNCYYLGQEDLPKTIHQLSHHEGWKPYIELHALVEICYSPCLEAILDAIEAQSPLNVDKITESLGLMTKVFLFMPKVLERFYGWLDPEEFMFSLKPLIWGWNIGSLKSGLLYEGVRAPGVLDDLSGTEQQKESDQQLGRRFIFTGPNGAQSIFLQATDIFLGVKHDPRDDAFFSRMRKYMTVQHKQFLEDIAKYSRIKEIVSSTKNPKLKSAYEKCLETVRNYRNDHTRLVTKYTIEPQAARVSQSKSPEEVIAAGKALAKFLQRMTANTK